MTTRRLNHSLREPVPFSGQTRIGADLHASWILSLPEGVSVTCRSETEVALGGAYGQLVLRRLHAVTRDAFQRLVHPGAPVGSLMQGLIDGGAPQERSRFLYHLRRLAGHGWLSVTAGGDTGPLATLIPTSPTFSLTSDIVPAGRCLLSRFACLHRIGDLPVLESPLAAARLLLHDQRMALLVHRLASPATVEDISTLLSGLSPERVQGVLRLLASAQLITAADETGSAAEDEADGLRFWEFHDLLFHARSRMGRTDAPTGGTFDWAGKVAPPPAVRTMEEPPALEASADAPVTVLLDRPDLEQIQECDVPFARVVEERMSVREYGSPPVTAGQLGEFLYRVARARERYEAPLDTPAGPILMEFAPRPYPAAGALYEIDLYPVVRTCAGLTPGLYRYDPLRHGLIRIPALETDVARLLKDAGLAAGIPTDELQVLLVLSARFGRIMWKYSSLAYAAILKHVGVLYESMYLTATAMKLGPCGLGTGDSDVFARAIGSDYFAETSVGEFLLGSRPPPSRRRGTAPGSLDPRPGERTPGWL